MLEQAITSFDGRDTAGLQAAARSLTVADGPVLMAWAGQSGRVAEAATWLIKTQVERGHRDGFDAPRLIAIGTAALDWPKALHILQLAQHWPDMADLTLGQTHLHHAKPMVRTWALDTYVRACLGGQGAPDLAQAELTRVLAMGKASERARARALAALLKRPDGQPI